MAEHILSPHDIAQRPRLNLGCGHRTHPDWINADLSPAGPEILPIDARRPLPFPDRSFDAVYHAHTLEHLTPDDGRRLIDECARVLKPAGVIRVTVPDLETIARLYLTNLDLARQGDREGEQRYDWILLELIDQMVRTKPGGRMLRHWARQTVPSEEFILERMGDEYAKARGSIERHRATHGAPPAWATGSPDADSVTDEVQHRMSGENHRWMYDSFSLSRLLMDAGFADPTTRSPTESAIEGWARYELETNPLGAAHKPDSIAVEASIPPSGA